MPTLPQGATPAPTPVVAIPQAGDPVAIYRALQSQGNILRDQQRDLQNQRSELQSDYDQMSSSNPGRGGVANRMTQIDARIADLDQQIAKSDQAVAQAAAVPGATVEPPRPPQQGPDPDMVAGLSFVVVLVFAIPISIAFARRIWRRSARAEVTVPPQLLERVEMIERGVEAIALEVERIGEGQRFLTQAMTERVEVRALGAGGVPELAPRAAERVEQRR